MKNWFLVRKQIEFFCLFCFKVVCFVLEKRKPGNVLNMLQVNNYLSSRSSQITVKSIECETNTTLSSMANR